MVSRNTHTRKKVVTFFFFLTQLFPCESEPLTAHFLHPSKLFEPFFEDPVSIATRVGCVCVCVCARLRVCPARLVAFWDAHHQHRAVPQASEDSGHHLKHSAAVSWFAFPASSEPFVQFAWLRVGKYGRACTPDLHIQTQTHTRTTCRYCRQLPRPVNVLLHSVIFCFSLISEAAASFCPASCLHAAVGNLEAEQRLSHPVSYHTLLSIGSLAVSISLSIPPLTSISIFISLCTVMHIQPPSAIYRLLTCLPLSFSLRPPPPPSFKHHLSFSPHPHPIPQSFVTCVSRWW